MIVRKDTTRIVGPGHATSLAELESQVLTIILDLEYKLHRLSGSNARIKNGICSGPLNSWQLPAATATQVRNHTFDLW